MRWSWTRWLSRRADLCPRPRRRRARSCAGCGSGQRQSPLEVVEAGGPALFVGANRFFIPEVAVGHTHRRHAFGLLEVEFHQRLPVFIVVVPGPGECQASRWVDLGVVTAAAMVGVLVWVAHDHAYGAADAQVDLCFGGLPVMLGVEPAAQNLLAGPSVEDRLGG